MRAKPSWRAERVGQQVLERRGKERQPAEGEVVIFFEDPEPVEVRGSLVDVSADGFRVSHQHRALCTGQRVTFHHAFAEGLAEVVWTRVLGNRAETGFLILTTSTL
ncbi:MAG TPA: PilZ domain-containing protein [Candidatus Acidoferrales bacterium]|jgi:hypothetical protein|nr:PilZ domain-containing protein [Candidatus Acidoferrales bacterium]